MGKCISIETARARRAPRLASGDEFPGRDRMKGLRVRRPERVEHGFWWSLSEWLGIRDGFDGARSRARVHRPRA